MLGRRFYRPEEESAVLGSQLTTGGGGRCMLLLRLIGSVQWASGGRVMVFGGLGWVVEAWRRGLQLGGFLDKIRAKCL